MRYFLKFQERVFRQSNEEHGIPVEWAQEYITFETLDSAVKYIRTLHDIDVWILSDNPFDEEECELEDYLDGETYIRKLNHYNKALSEGPDYDN